MAADPRPTPATRGAVLFEEASSITPGGGAASVRYNRALERTVYFARGDGARITDVDGTEFLDMCVSHGASILGHNHPHVRERVVQALDMGILCSYETEHHVDLARRMCDMVPGADMVRFSGSGTETVMHAVRLARAVTGRDKLIKFEGHFHGYSDHVYWSSAPPVDQAGPAHAPIPFQQSAGIPDVLRDQVIVVPFNEPAALEAALKTHADEVAAVIMEPVNYDAGCILPQPGFLESVRALTTDHDVLLLFDEVLTAFRIAAGGAQEYYGVVPDLAVLGKATGGGLPLSAIAGKREVMAHLRPLGDAEHSGTYMGHLVPVMGSLGALETLSQPDVYKRLFEVGDRLYDGLSEQIGRTGIRARLQHLGPRFFIYFGLDPDIEVTNYRAAAAHSPQTALAFSREMMARGVYFHDYGGGLAHHGYSTAHSEADMDEVLEATERAFRAIA